MPKPPPRRDGKKGKGYYKKRVRKACEFCIDKALRIDYKDLGLVRRYITDRAKIKPRRMTGCCAKHQRKVAVAVKRARVMALIPFTTE